VAPSPIGLSEWESWLRPLQSGADPLVLLKSALEWLRRRAAARTALLILPATAGVEGIDFALVSGQGEEELHGLRLRPEETVLDDLLQKRQIWRFYDAGEHEPHSRGLRRSFRGLHSGIGVPLPGLTGAALVLVNRRSDEPFTESDEALLTQIAPLFTLGLHLSQLRRTLERYELEREWLHRLPEQLGEEFSLQRVLDAVEPLLRAIAPLAGGIWLYNEDKTRLLCILHYGVPLLSEELDPAILPANWQSHPTTLPENQELETALFPLMLAGRVLGLLAFGTRAEPLPLAPADFPPKKPTMGWLGHIALLVGHAMLYEQLARRAQHMAILYEVSLKLGEVRTIAEWLTLLTESARRLVPADRCVIYLAEEEAARLLPASVSPADELLLHHYPSVPYSLPGWVYAFNAPLAAPDLPNHPQNRKEPLPGIFQSALTVPIQVAEQPLGALMLLTLQPREFMLAEVEALFMLANFSAMRLQAAQHERVAQRL
jgi:GAF domain-containing protein